jgi:4-amino-4-deoxy-L-arabinose transferase-like glycosyltransferase
MHPQVIPAALILVAFIGLCLLCLLRWMDHEMNRK